MAKGHPKCEGRCENCLFGYSDFEVTDDFGKAA